MSHHDREGPRSPERDAAVKRAWQQASDQQPPSQLDAAIIAAARKAVQDREEQATGVRVSAPSRNWSTRWQPLAAAATVAGLAFVLVQSLPRDRDVAPPVRMEEPVRRPATAQQQESSPSARATTEDAARKRPFKWACPSPGAARCNARERTEPAVPPPDTVHPSQLFPTQGQKPRTHRPVPVRIPGPVPVPRRRRGCVARERSRSAPGGGVRIGEPRRVARSWRAGTGQQSGQYSAAERRGLGCKYRGALRLGRCHRCGRHIARVSCCRSGRRYVST